MECPCSTKGQRRHSYRFVVGNPAGKRPLRRPRRRWLDNNRMDLGEVGWSDMNWIGLAQDRGKWGALVKAVRNFRETIEWLYIWWPLE
jgi:hypothetical protein